MAQELAEVVIVSSLFPSVIDKFLLETVKRDKWYYPNVGKLNTLEKIEARKEKVKTMYMRDKSWRRRQRYTNEWTILTGKEFSMRFSKLSNSANAATLMHRIDEWYVYEVGQKCMKPEEYEKYRADREVIIAATYFHAGTVLMDIEKSCVTAAAPPKVEA
jgi:hypothetical protein